MPVVQHNLAAVRHYASEGKSQRWIAKELQIDRKTVRKIIQLYPDSLRKRKYLAKSFRKDSCCRHDLRGIFGTNNE